MSLYDYLRSRDVAVLDVPFYTLIMAALRQADTENAEKIRLAWPDVAQEFKARYNAPGGVLAGEETRYD